MEQANESSDTTLHFCGTSKTSDEWSGLRGLTLHLNSSGGQVNKTSPYTNWSKAKIYINKAYCSSTSSETRETAAYELGHAMGLMHVGRTDLLMYYDYSKRTVSKPQQDEFNGIAHLY